jgi:protein-tyrosine-phosphatase
MDRETRSVLISLIKAIQSLTHAVIEEIEVTEDATDDPDNETATALSETLRQLKTAVEILSGKDEAA